jgi:hypothetical protein
MLKFIIGFERKATMSRPDCHRHLRDVHGPLVKSVQDFTQYVRGYVQNYALEELPEFNRSFVADGAAELWFDSPDAFVQAYSEPLYLSNIRPDEANFTNPGRYVASFAHERTLWQDDTRPGIKLMRFIPAGASATPADTRSIWERQHAERLRDHAEFRRTVRRYVQNWSIHASDNPFPLAQAFPVVEEFWVADRTAATTLLRIERELLAKQPYGEVLDLDAAICLLATEGEVI